MANEIYNTSHFGFSFENGFGSIYHNIANNVIVAPGEDLPGENFEPRKKPPKDFKPRNPNEFEPQEP